MPRTEASLPLSLSLIAFGVAEVVGGIWTLVVYLKSLGQVQGFSAWKALGNSCLAGLVIIVPVAILVFVVLALTDL